jgi:hypothetical protein
MNPGVLAARYLSAGNGAALGAGVGAIAGGLRSPQEGGSRLRGALGGAARGAVVGAAAGGLGRGYQDTRLLNPGMSAVGAVGGTAKRMGQGISNFGKRQVYGVTGRGDPNAIGMAGNATSGRKIDLLERRRDHALRGSPSKDHMAIRQKAEATIAGERRSGVASQELQDAGVTSIPGIAKGLMSKDKRGLALRAMGKSLTAGPGGLAMGLGVPVAMSAPSLAKGDESATGGLTTGQKVRNLGLNVASGAALGGLPIVSQAVMGTGIDAVLSRIGKRRADPKAPQPIRHSLYAPPGATQ